MGVMGSGKSHLIQWITKKKDVRVGHGLQSETTEMSETTFSHRGTKYALVDTPGFDDTVLGYEEVVSRILEWLAALDGIIYLHSLNSPRMTYSSKASLRMFRRLCGSEGFSRVILGTTFWDPIAEERESQLCNWFWPEMIEKGSQVARIFPDRASGLRQIEAIARIARGSPMSLRFLSEIAADSAGRVDVSTTSAYRQTLRDLQGPEARQKLVTQWREDIRGAYEKGKQKLKSRDRAYRQRVESLEGQLKAAVEGALSHRDITSELKSERRRLEREHYRSIIY
ncbi:hypothetical protein B0T24DRAFT_533244 [Lasiosphaeria ovina]|uniref:G domain-containing protein n=1 Tax=Lasiosphaeria ovina TaxID=92902 RepID=A0AAE0K3I1_9PEZI|nr:hypothetical protein B0T24DRAFT_533244 [Lasiosphaeria ovina]